MVGWSAVCDCGIPCSYSLTFLLLSSYSSIILIKIQQKSGIGVIRGGGGYYAIPRTQNISHVEYWPEQSGQSCLAM